MFVKCPSVQLQPDGLTIHTDKWFLGAGFLGAPPISLNPPRSSPREGRSDVSRSGAASQRRCDLGLGSTLQLLSFGGREGCCDRRRASVTGSDGVPAPGPPKPRNDGARRQARLHIIYSTSKNHTISYQYTYHACIIIMRTRLSSRDAARPNWQDGARPAYDGVHEEVAAVVDCLSRAGLVQWAVTDGTGTPDPNPRN